MANPIIPTGDIFSKRQKKLRGEVPDVYVYNDLPDPLRQQIVYILEDTFDEFVSFYSDKKEDRYKYIVKILRDEHGVRQIATSKEYYRKPVYQSEFDIFLLHNKDIEKTIDAIEISFRVFGTSMP